jgi:tripartite-type tricarboxylate transporter receptor subunit TctC
LAPTAAAHTYPSRPIHIVVSSSPGGVTKWSRLIRDANIKVD